jgi:MarR family transcriptional regulator, lower aerobic nicotinate degradation pathway regulator
MQQISVALFAEECQEFGLTCLQYSALARIRERPGIDVTRLSEIMHFDRSTLGGVIERLEAKNYIQRSGTEKDKRIKILEVTKLGKSLLAQIEPHLARVNRRVMGSLSVEEQKGLTKLLSRLIDANADVVQFATMKSALSSPAGVVVPLKRKAR